MEQSLEFCLEWICPVSVCAHYRVNISEWYFSLWEIAKRAQRSVVKRLMTIIFQMFFMNSLWNYMISYYLSKLYVRFCSCWWLVHLVLPSNHAILYNSDHPNEYKYSWYRVGFNGDINAERDADTEDVPGGGASLIYTIIQRHSKMDQWDWDSLLRSHMAGTDDAH